MAASRRDSRMEPTAPSRRTPPPARQPPRGLAVIPLYVWGLGVVVVLLLTMVAALWALYVLRGQWAPSGPTPTPIIWTPTPPPVVPTATPTPPPVEPTPTAPAGIVIGGYVQVSGTEGLGLSLREGPGMEYQRMGVALEGEVFEVVDGPTQAGDVTWWKVRDPDDASRSWWAAANFLQPVPAP